MPFYTTGVINNNPVIRFTSGTYLLLSSRYLYSYDNTEFAVYRTTNTSGVITANTKSTLILNPTSCDKILALT